VVFSILPIKYWRGKYKGYIPVFDTLSAQPLKFERDLNRLTQELQDLTILHFSVKGEPSFKCPLNGVYRQFKYRLKSK